MRAWMIAAAVLLLAGTASAQRAKPGSPTKSEPAAKRTEPAAAAAQDPRLERLLGDWEKKSSNVTDLECEFKRITRDPLFKTEDVEFGQASAIRPYRARLDLFNEKGEYTEIFIYTGKRLHLYDFRKKQEHIFVLPDPDPGVQQTLPGPLGLLSGMSAAEAKARFSLKLVREFSKDGVDYAEVIAVPRTAADQQEFKTAQMIIDRRTFLPKELRVIEPNGKEQHWIFDRLETNLKPPVSAKQLEPFDRNKVRELEKWERITNNYGEPPRQSEAPKTKTPPTSNAQPDSRKTPRK